MAERIVEVILSLPPPGVSQPFERIAHIPSHKSPPDDGVVYIEINRSAYRVKTGEYTGTIIRLSAQPPIPASHDLWKIEPGGGDSLVGDNDVIRFAASGFRFFTTPRYINAGQDAETSAAQPEPDTGGV